MYLEYDDYTEMGGTLDENTFNDYEFEAECLVDYYTFNRLKNDTEYPDALPRLMYRLIALAVDKALSMGGNVITADGDVITAGVTSQSNDGVSESYNVLSAGQVYDSVKAESERLINQYLQGVMNSLGQKVLYRGLYPNE